MAVYTEVPDEELERFLDDFDLGDLLSVKGIAEGVENSNFLLRTGSGTFILTIYEKRVHEIDLPFFLGLLDHLSARGLTCPMPIRDRSGNSAKRLAGKPAAIVTFLEGIWVRRPQVAHCAAVGEALARLHLAARDFYSVRLNALSLAAWRPLLEASGKRADRVAAGLYEDLSTELSTLEAHWPSDLPTGVIHADLFPDNVFFLRGTLSGLIDFYFACNDTLAYDIAICLNAWCFEQDGAFNVTKAKALLAGYEKVRPLEKVEIAALPILSRGAALRFLLTRLFDWLTVPEGALVKPKDPLEYLRKLRFHRRVASVREYGLAA
jgi:homoserine kinase type II